MAGESAAVTEAVALTPATAGPSGPAAPRTAAAPVAVVATAAEPRPAYTRPLVLVPQQRRQRRQRGRDRILTFRVVLFVLVFVAVLVGAGGVVVWFNNASFFVGLDRGYVAIFQGRPGGLLWFKPSVVERTTLKPSELLASNVVYLRQGMEESSYVAARNVVRNLSLERSRIVAEEVTTTTAPLRVTTTSRPSAAPAVIVTTTTSAPAATVTTTSGPKG